MGKLTDATTAELRRLHGDGASQATLALRFGISQSHVSRIVAGERRPVAEPMGDAMRDAVGRYLDGHKLEGAAEIIGASARILAHKLDAVAASEAVGAAQATPALVRQLLEVVAVIEPDSDKEIEAQLKRMIAPLKVLAA